MSSEAARPPIECDTRDGPKIEAFDGPRNIERGESLAAPNRNQRGMPGPQIRL